jgi:hypothetical protein
LSELCSRIDMFMCQAILDQHLTVKSQKRTQLGALLVSTCFEQYVYCNSEDVCELGSLSETGRLGRLRYCERLEDSQS